ncbi:MAG: hypothetical protein GXP31_02740 [Kiritimatiellaeota bacterium]|nr:hypothetical protein [Kiritimatiellota bacterium]
MPSRIKNLLGRSSASEHKAQETDGQEESLEQAILQEDQQEDFEKDRSILDDGAGLAEKKVQKEAEKEVQSAAMDSLKRLHMIQMGRCPKCSGHLRRHLFASICDSCGWHTFDTPREGPVRVHLKSGAGVVEGERCYRVQTGAVLVLKGDLVVAQVPKDSVGWIEYIWSEEEIEQRHKHVLERASVRCAWCDSEADPEKDGFHLVQVAFGTSQERYCFCSDKCYEAFRKMYPARVHRNCYERNCAECNLCVKRYEDETEGVHLLAKDFLRVKQLKKK